MSYRTFLAGYTQLADKAVSSIANLFFKKKIYPASLKVEIDRYTRSAKAARFSNGQINTTSLGPIKTTVIEPEDVSESIGTQGRQLFAVMPGEDRYSPNAMSADLIIAKELGAMHATRRDLIAVDVLSTGIVKGKDSRVVYDFGRDSALTSTAADWSSTANPFETIQAVISKMRIDHLAPSGDILMLMGSAAARKFFGNPKVQTSINSRINTMAQNAMNDPTRQDAGPGLVQHMSIFPDQISSGRFKIFESNAVYSDDSDTIKSVVPDDVCIIIPEAIAAESSALSLGVFIPSSFEKLKFVSGADEHFYSWVDMQSLKNNATCISRPYLVPSDINNTGCIFVA